MTPTTPSEWSISEVGAWLEARGLGKFRALFAEHEVDGAVLLSLAPKDLDFMGLTTLGPRKKLLSSVSELRRAAVAAAGGETKSALGERAADNESVGGICVRYLCILVVYIVLYLTLNDSVLELLGVGRRIQAPVPTPAALQLSALRAASAKRAQARSGGFQGAAEEL